MDGYEIRPNGELEGYDLIKKDSIETPEGKIDEVVATIYDIESLKEFITKVIHDMKKRKIKIRWTCSDYWHHAHRFKMTAWLCGKLQQAVRWWRR